MVSENKTKTSINVQHGVSHLVPTLWTGNCNTFDHIQIIIINNSRICFPSIHYCDRSNSY